MPDHRLIGYPRRPLPADVRAPFTPGEPWAMTPAAREFHESRAPIKALLGGFGASKTTVLCAEGIFAALANPGRVGALYEPSIPLVRDVLVPSMDFRLAEFGLRRGRDWTFAKTETAWHLFGGASRGGSTILGRSAGPDAADRIVGLNLAFAGIDEPAKVKRDAVREIRLRVRPHVRLFITGTPDPGTWVVPWAAHPPDGAHVVRASTLDNPHMTQAYIDGMAEEYDAVTLRAYLHGESVVLSGGAYHAFRNAPWPDGNVQRVEYAPASPLVIALDNNRDPMCCALLQAGEGMLRQFAEVTIRGGSWGGLTEAIAAKVSTRPAGIYLCGDADLRGKIHDTQTDWGAYQALAEHLATLWPGIALQLRVPKANPLVVSRLEAANRLLCDATGRRRFVIDPSCREQIADREQVTLDENGAISKRVDKMRTHHSDAVDYVIAEMFPLMRARSGVPQVA